MGDALVVPGWTVRQVAAHITHSTTNWGVLMPDLLRSGFQFNALMMRMARDDRRSPAEITAALRAMGFPFNTRKRFPNTKFTATDAEFSVGSGEEVRGPIQDILRRCRVVGPVCPWNSGLRRRV